MEELKKRTMEENNVLLNLDNLFRLHYALITV